jgi:peptide/nickel transport system permease protein
VSTGPVAIGSDQFGGLPPQGPLDPGAPSASTGRLTGASRAVMGDANLWAPVAVFALLVLFAIFAPIIWGQNPDAQNLLNSLASPSSTHPMGTDELGRDVFSRVASGARISLLFALIVSLTGAVIGGIIGLVAGTMGGASDGVTMRFMDAILAFPPLILAMAVTVGLGVGVFTAGIGIALVSIPWYARVMRSEAIRIRSLPFIEAAYAMGATRSRIIRRHILPHLLPVLFIQMAAAFGYAVLALAGLSFVGLGAQVPTPEWGAMITEGLSYALTGQWWVSVFPGVFLLITVTAANILSDRLRDVLDPSGNMARS